MGLVRESSALSLHDVRTFVGSQKKFSDVSGPQFDTSSDVDIVGVFQKFFDITLTQHTEESTTYVRRQATVSFTPFNLTKRIRKWKDKAVDRKHVQFQHFSC